jgi:hypothetical protein
MKKSTIAIIILTPLIILYLFLFGNLIYKRNFPRIKPGQVWEYNYNEKNPFEVKITSTYKVISVKDGYVQYIINGKDTSSCVESMFRYNTLVKK